MQPKKKKPSAVRTSSGVVPTSIRPPSIEALIRWTLTFAEGGLDRTPFLVLPGSAAERSVFIERYRSPQYERYRPGTVEDLSGPQTSTWLSEGLCRNITTRVAAAKLPGECYSFLPPWFPPEPGVWEVLWGLISVEELVVEEPLRTMLDQDAYVIHDVYRVLWEARFLAKENVNLAPAQAFVRTLARWVTTSLLTVEDEANLRSLGIRREITSDQRFDLLCFFFTLAAQNALTNRFMVYFDGLEQASSKHIFALRELYRLLMAVERWTKIGPCPIGILIGHTASALDLQQLSQLHERLGTKIIEGLNWVREDGRRR